MYPLIPYIWSEGIILLLYFLADVNFDSPESNHDGSMEMREINHVVQIDEHEEENARVDLFSQEVNAHDFRSI